MVELSGRRVRRDACPCARDLLANRGCRLCGRAETFALFDEALRPLGPGILWSDQRAGAHVDRFGEPSVFRSATGVVLNGASCVVKLAWVAEHERDRFAAARWVLAPRDFVLARLLGDDVVTDPTLRVANRVLPARRRARRSRGVHGRTPASHRPLGKRVADRECEHDRERSDGRTRARLVDRDRGRCGRPRVRGAGCRREPDDADGVVGHDDECLDTGFRRRHGGRRRRSVTGGARRSCARGRTVGEWRRVRLARAPHRMASRRAVRRRGRGGTRCGRPARAALVPWRAGAVVAARRARRVRWLDRRPRAG